MKFELDCATEILRQTPDTLTQMLGGLSPEWTVTKDDKTDWSPYDVVGHLIHCEETDWIPRAEVILAQGVDRTFPPFDRFSQFEKYRDQSLAELLYEFKRARIEGLATLTGWHLTPETVYYTNLRAHETVLDLVCRLLLEKKNSSKTIRIPHAPSILPLLLYVN